MNFFKENIEYFERKLDRNNFYKGVPVPEIDAQCGCFAKFVKLSDSEYIQLLKDVRNIIDKKLEGLNNE